MLRYSEPWATMDHAHHDVPALRLPMGEHCTVAEVPLRAMPAHRVRAGRSAQRPRRRAGTARASASGTGPASIKPSPPRNRRHARRGHNRPRGHRRAGTPSPSSPALRRAASSPCSGRGAGPARHRRRGALVVRPRGERPAGGHPGGVAPGDDTVPVVPGAGPRGPGDRRRQVGACRPVGLVRQLGSGAGCSVRAAGPWHQGPPDGPHRGAPLRPGGLAVGLAGPRPLAPLTARVGGWSRPPGSRPGPGLAGRVLPGSVLRTAPCWGATAPTAPLPRPCFPWRPHGTVQEGPQNGFLAPGATGAVSAALSTAGRGDPGPLRVSAAGVRTGWSRGASAGCPGVPVHCTLRAGAGLVRRPRRTASRRFAAPARPAGPGPACRCPRSGPGVRPGSRSAGRVPGSGALWPLSPSLPTAMWWAVEDSNL